MDSRFRVNERTSRAADTSVRTTAFFSVERRFDECGVPTIAARVCSAPTSAAACARHSTTRSPSKVSSARRIATQGTVSFVRLQ